jgi:hypothetical protein
MSAVTTNLLAELQLKKRKKKIGGRAAVANDCQ